MARKKKEETMEETVTNEETMEETVTDEETEATPDTRSKREIIADVIEAGGATMESLMEAAACKYASVMSNFSMLRLMGKCAVKDVDTEIPVLDEDGNETFDDAGEVATTTIQTYRFVTADEWKEIQAAKATNAKAKKAPARTPEEQKALLEKRIEKLNTAKANADKRAEEGDSEILNLRAQKADIECQIAGLELAEIQAKIDAE